MRRRALALLIVLVLFMGPAAFLIVSCGGGGGGSGDSSISGSSGTGSVAVFVADGPADECNEINIFITGDRFYTVVQSFIKGVVLGFLQRGGIILVTSIFIGNKIARH